MSEKEKKAMDSENGVEAISDDQMDAVAGGYYNDIREMRRQAELDGRPNAAPNTTKFCWCGRNQAIFYRTAYPNRNGKGYDEVSDARCYNCGSTARTLQYPLGTFR